MLYKLFNKQLIKLTHLIPKHCQVKRKHIRSMSKQEIDKMVRDNL